MNTPAKHVLVLVGGASPEHSISLRSGAAVLRALAATRHRVSTVAITQAGVWHLGDFAPMLETAEAALIEFDGTSGQPVTLGWDGRRTRLVALGGDTPRGEKAAVDVVFPVLHGPGGEDGSVQGFLESVRVPFVGAGSTASALAMDKLAMKTLCSGVGLPQVEFLDACEADSDEVAASIEGAFGFPCFVKPSNLGSSVGITRVDEAAALPDALAEARRYDPRVVVERAVDAREIEIAVLGHDPAELSPPGEIVPQEGFYDFDAKYVASTAGLLAPADLPEPTVAQIGEMASTAWKLIGGRGMARIDFFVDRGNGAVYLNEINTIPGFTEISMYPRLWREAGLSMVELVERLLELALDT